MTEDELYKLLDSGACPCCRVKGRLTEHSSHFYIISFCDNCKNSWRLDTEKKTASAE